MAVNYVAPSPVLSSSSVYGRNRGRGGVGSGGASAFASTQAPVVVDPTGDQQNRLALAGLQGTIEQDTQQQRLSGQSRLQLQAAELDAWQFQQRVTAQESAQLRADQNSIQAIQADPSMTPAEKQSAILRVKTRIDWVSERQKRDLQQAQSEQQQQLAKQVKMETDLMEERLKFQSQGIGNKFKTIVDDDAAQEISEMLLDTNPALATNPVAFALEVTKEAVRQGRATRYAADAHGNVKLSDGVRVGQEQGKEGGAHAGTRVGGKGKGDDEDGRWERARADAIKALSGGTEPPSLDAIEAAAKRLMNKPEDESKKKVAEDHLKDLENITNKRNSIPDNPNLLPAEKQQAAKILEDVLALTQKYPADGQRPRPAPVQKRLDELKKSMQNLDANVSARVESQRAARGKLLGSYGSGGNKNPLLKTGNLARGVDPEAEKTRQHRIQLAVVMLKGGYDEARAFGNNMSPEDIAEAKRQAGR